MPHPTHPPAGAKILSESDNLWVLLQLAQHSEGIIHEGDLLDALAQMFPVEMGEQPYGPDEAVTIAEDLLYASGIDADKFYRWLAALKGKRLGSASAEFLALLRRDLKGGIFAATVSRAPKRHLYLAGAARALPSRVRRNPDDEDEDEPFDVGNLPEEIPESAKKLIEAHAHQIADVYVVEDEEESESGRVKTTYTYDVSLAEGWIIPPDGLSVYAETVTDLRTELGRIVRDPKAGPYKPRLVQARPKAPAWPPPGVPPEVLRAIETLPFVTYPGNPTALRPELRRPHAFRFNPSELWLWSASAVGPSEPEHRARLLPAFIRHYAPIFVEWDVSVETKSNGVMNRAQEILDNLVKAQTGEDPFTPGGLYDRAGEIRKATIRARKAAQAPVAAPTPPLPVAPAPISARDVYLREMVTADNRKQIMSVPARLRHENGQWVLEAQDGSVFKTTIITKSAKRAHIARLEFDPPVAGVKYVAIALAPSATMMTPANDLGGGLPTFSE